MGRCGCYYEWGGVAVSYEWGGVGVAVIMNGALRVNECSRGGGEEGGRRLFSLCGGNGGRQWVTPKYTATP